MVCWTAIKTTWRDVSGRGHRYGRLGHERTLHRGTGGGGRGRGGGGGGVGRIGRTAGVLEEACLWLREGKSGQSVGGRGGGGERGGAGRERRGGQVALGGLGALVLEEGGGGGAGREGAAGVAQEGRPGGAATALRQEAAATPSSLLLLSPGGSTGGRGPLGVAVVGRRPLRREKWGPAGLRGRGGGGTRQPVGQWFGSEGGGGLLQSCMREGNDTRGGVRGHMTHSHRAPPQNSA